MLNLIGRPKWLFVFLAAAFVILYVALDKQLAGYVKNAAATLNPPSSAEKTAAAHADLDRQAAALTAAPQPGPAQVPMCDLESALSFDVTPQWVAATWPSASAAAGDAEHSALRVPLVTGMMPDDLAGTLTYYFDQDQRVQRITFAGSTIDPRRLVGLMTSQFGLKAQPTRDIGLYQSRWNGEPISTLALRHASTPHDRGVSVDVQLDLKRVDARAGVSGRGSRLFGW